MATAFNEVTVQAAAPITRGSGAHQVAGQEEPSPSKPSVHLFQAVLLNAAGIPVPGRPRGPRLGRWGKEQQAQGSGQPGAPGVGVAVKAISRHAFSCRPGRGSALGPGCPHRWRSCGMAGAGCTRHQGLAPPRAGHGESGAWLAGL